MKIVKIFDVVELIDGNKATILEIDKDKDKYKVEVVNENGISQGNKYISLSEINDVIFPK